LLERDAPTGSSPALAAQGADEGFGGRQLGFDLVEGLGHVGS
jgi:hypothetical protein